MKRITSIVIILVVAFFIIGYLLVIVGWMNQSTYNQIATIAGGLASTVGLLTFVLPSLRTSDIKSIEIETLKSLAKTAEEIQQKEKELNKKQDDLTKLELQQQELEFLVKKASLNLFFKEQMEKYYETLDRQISENREISRTINEIKELEYKIEELEIEINKSPNTEQIMKIIEDARKHRLRAEIKSPIDLLARLFLLR
jgi:hypothetical protein